MRTVCVVPLRGGSKSIPKKNIKEIAGKPLAAWVLEAATSAKSIDKVYVSTDCPEITEVVENLDLGVEVIHRPDEYATDEASTESVLLHFTSEVEYDVLVTIQSTSPMLAAQDLELALEKFDSDQLDSMLSATRVKRFFWDDKGIPLNYDPLDRPRRQDFKGTLMENGAFYITKREILEQHECRLGGNIGVFEMDETCATEIDEPEDWVEVQNLLLSLRR